jgi:glutamyl-tRNA reductase
MASLAATALRRRGVQTLTITSRTHTHAQQLAHAVNAHTLPFESLADGLAQARLVVVATAAPHFVVQAADVPVRATPLVIQDLAVPRNVAPAVRDLPNVVLHDLDDLQAYLAQAEARRQQSVPQAEALAAAEAQAYIDTWPRRAARPLVAAWRAQAEAIRRAEVDRALRRLDHLTPADRQRIEALTQAVVNKLLHTATERLQAPGTAAESATETAAITRLFGLSG